MEKDAIIVDEAIRSSRALLTFYDFEVPGTFHRSAEAPVTSGGKGRGVLPIRFQAHPHSPYTAKGLRWEGTSVGVFLGKPLRLP